MTRILKANLKTFMGAKYERVMKTILTWAVVLFAISPLDLRLEIAPIVVWLTAVLVTVGGFVGVLSSDDTSDSLRGQLMLPESPVMFHAAYFISVAIYTFLTKTGLLLIVYIAISEFTLSTAAGFAACFIVSGAVTYPFAFRPEKKVTARAYTRSAKHNFGVYILRYLRNNKNYLVNTFMLWAFGCAFAVFISGSGFTGALPFGFALMCLNTPLGILLSGDRALYRQVRFLPDQATGVLLPYALFVAVANAAACAIYLIVWYLSAGHFSSLMAVIAALFAILSALMTIALEAKFPLLNWKTESDLWHHPRKYIVPAVLVLAAAMVITTSGGL